MLAASDFDMLRSWVVVRAVTSAKELERAKGKERALLIGEFSTWCEVVGKITDLSTVFIADWCKEVTDLEMDVAVDTVMRKFGVNRTV